VAERISNGNIRFYMNNLVFRLLTVAAFFGAGIWCLTQARKIQKRAIETSKELDLKLFRRYINSRSYLVVTRVAGVICLVIALLLGLTLFRG
jgi:hypothetical protein